MPKPMTFVVCFLLIAAGCATDKTRVTKTRVDHKHGDFTKHYVESDFARTTNGLYSIEMIILEGQLKKGPNKVDLIVHDRSDADVMGAAVEVTPWMPAMGHGVFDKPVVIERGGGLYSVENIVFSMGGPWELRVKVAAEAGEDEAVLPVKDVVEETAGHEHRGHKTMSRPAAIDTTRTVLTGAGTFRVRYAPRSAPAVRINRVQQWTVHIERPDGAPVNGADITVDGEMPEHGHGLPTRPRVTKNLGGGDYLVDGMKFQMPGWWVVTFRIEAGGQTDTATFNLDLQ